MRTLEKKKNICADNREIESDVLRFTLNTESVRECVVVCV